MPKLKPRTIFPRKEEDDTINRGIASDPDTYELGGDEMKHLKRVGRPNSDNPKVLISDGQPTYALAHMKGDLDVMQACMRAEIENYWRQPDGDRLTAAPYFFERTAILQRKAKNYGAEVAACEAWVEIVEDYKNQDSVKNGSGTKVWLGSRSRKIEDRPPKARDLLKRQHESGQKSG
ncbi:hypothetical protein H0A71_21110 [Alcaligenaceae bacterium]|nr:hypothetical protein [Alcaligenaceae bacterium]